MVNLLQFIVFMTTWQVLIPDFTIIFLKSLKSLALFEFLPTEKITQLISSWFSDCTEDCNLEQSTFDELGMVFLAGLGILISCLVLGLLALLVRRCPKVEKCYQGLK